MSSSKSTLNDITLLLAVFLYFERIKVGLCNHHVVFLTPAHCEYSYMYHLSLPGNGSAKKCYPNARQRLVKHVTMAATEKLLDEVYAVSRRAGD
jgi:hypothetical protein